MINLESMQPRMSRGQDVVEPDLMQPLFLCVIASVSACSPSARARSCDRVQLWTNLNAPCEAGGVLIVEESETAGKVLCHSHTPTHVTRYMNAPQCLLGADWPGPTSAPALSNTRCRSPSAAGAGGLWCISAHKCLCVCVCVHALT